MRKSIHGLMAALVLSGQGILAEEHPSASLVPLVIGGTHIADNNTYTYLGGIRPVWDGELGRGWFHSAIASYLTYSYDTDIGGSEVEIDARAPGIDFGIGYGWSGPGYSLSLSSALGYRRFDLSPDVRSEKPNGSQVAFTPQVQANYRFTDHWDGDLISNYSAGPRSTFNRLRVGYRPPGDWRFGPEFIYQEGRNYRNLQWGLFTGIPMGNGFAVELSAGQMEEDSGDTGGYVAIAFSKVR